MAAEYLNTGMFDPANNSPERTQPQRGCMYDVAVLRRSVRCRWASEEVRSVDPSSFDGLTGGCSRRGSATLLSRRSLGGRIGILASEEVA
jgi:hypothetical protein